MTTFSLSKGFFKQWPIWFTAILVYVFDYLNKSYGFSDLSIREIIEYCLDKYLPILSTISVGTLFGLLINWIKIRGKMGRERREKDAIK